MSNKIIIHDDQDFKICYEETGEMPMAHCEVINWSPSIAKRVRQVIDRLVSEHRRDVMGIALPGDKKHHKFLRMMGFEFFRNKWIVDSDDQDLTVSIWIRYYNK